MNEKTTETRTTEFEDGSKIETTTTIENEYIEGESPAEIVSEVVEEITAEENPTISDAVAIAEIQAERDVTIAAIQSETTTALIEAEQERENSWQEEIADLRANMQELREVMKSLKAEAPQSTQEPLMEAEPVPEMVEMETENSTQEFTSPPTSETPTALILEREGEKPVEILAIPARRKRRLI